MPISHDQMLRTRCGNRYVFVPYAPCARHNCNGLTCAFFCNVSTCLLQEGRLQEGRACLDWDRKDGRAGYWKRADSLT